MPRAIAALVIPPSASAISTPTAPAATAPTIGMKAVKNVSSAMGSTSGTPRIRKPRPMKTASMSATSAVPRT